MMKKRAILYLRYSDHRQDGGTSIDVQEKVSKNYCEAVELDIVDIEKNEAVSADSKKQTHRVADLLEYCKERKKDFDILVVYKLDRFARGQEQHHWLRGQLLKMDILLRSATEKIDETPSGRLVEGVLAAVNEYDNEVKRERVKLAMWRRVEQGLWPWHPPVGYLVKRRDGEKLSPHVFDSTCSDAIKAMFVRYSTGTVSKAELSHIMRARKIKTYRGRIVKFSKQGIDSLLNNLYFIGMLRHKDGRIIKGKHKALIDSSLFEKCQEVQNNNPKTRYGKRTRNHENFPLRRFVLCGECDKPLTGTYAKGKYAHYYCYNPKCSFLRKTIRGFDLENRFSDYLSQVKPTDEFIERFEKRFINRYKEREQEIRGEYLQKLKEVDILEKDVRWIIDKGKKGVLSDSTVKDQLIDTEKRLTLAKMSLTEMHAEELDINALLAYAADFIRTLEKTWIDALFVQKSSLQRLIFPEGVKYKNSKFTNSKISPLFNVIHELGKKESSVVSPEGFEPPTFRM